jgi:hypothetical protein
VKNEKIKTRNFLIFKASNLLQKKLGYFFPPLNENIQFEPRKNRKIFVPFSENSKNKKLLRHEPSDTSLEISVWIDLKHLVITQ